MPVRKFFNNTFGRLLNDALYALEKKQEKEPDNEEIFTKNASIAFVAKYLLENLPDNEKNPFDYEGGEDDE